METIKSILKYLFGILVSVLGYLALTKKDTSEEEKELQEHKEEILEKIDEIEKQEVELEKKKEEGYSEEEILDYWENRDESR